MGRGGESKGCQEMALVSSSAEGCHTRVGTQGKEAVTLARPVTYRGAGKCGETWYR